MKLTNKVKPSDLTISTIGSRPTQIQELSISTLEINGQRETREHWCKKYLKEHDNRFDWRMYGVASVAHIKDTDEYRVYDGGHRIRMLQWAYPKIETFPCLVHEVETEADANVLFHRMNGKARHSVNPEELFISMYFAGEQKALDISDVLNQADVCVRSIKTAVPADREYNVTIRSFEIMYDRCYDTNNIVKSIQLIKQALPNVKRVSQLLLEAIWYGIDGQIGKGRQCAPTAGVKWLKKNHPGYAQEFKDWFANSNNWNKFSNWLVQYTQFRGNALNPLLFHDQRIHNRDNLSIWYCLYKEFYAWARNNNVRGLPKLTPLQTLYSTDWSL